MLPIRLSDKFLAIQYAKTLSEAAFTKTLSFQPALVNAIMPLSVTLSPQIFKRVGWVATRLLLVPGIIEAFFDGGLAIKLFDMPATFAFATGFILKAVGPALVIQCMFEVQQKGLGTAKGGPALSSLWSVT